jgi:hypothetical protein
MDDLTMVWEDNKYLVLRIPGNEHRLIRSPQGAQAPDQQHSLVSYFME